jgi:hypothetical protein
LTAKNMEKLEDKTTTDSLNTSTVSSSIDEIEASDFTEEEAKKAETFKAEGNEYFKCK